MRDSAITLAHGSGGKAMRNLIEEICLENFANPLLAPLEDSLRFDMDRCLDYAAVASALVKPLWACT